MELLRNFKGVSKNDVSLAGGKGASLGEMTQAGISVPSGFVILASAFEKFLEETDLNVEIDAILGSVNHKTIHTVEDASEKIRALILSAEMPQDIATEIQRFFKNLGSKYVAVRSSATAEDSASAAWAGQLESYLNTTEETLLENVKKCWASLFTPRAIFYRFEKNLHKQIISVAVVIQKMVESEKSGIAFSVHPVTQDRNQLIIEAGFGLGEAIVSGQITPDSYVVEKQPRRIIDINVQTQTKGLYRAENGGNQWQDVPKEQGEKQVLSDQEILELSEVILKIENHYGFPCDIEWAFENGKFHITQSRPITTLDGRINLNQEKDGDIVEVDADNGVVRILEQGVQRILLANGRVGSKSKNFFESAPKRAGKKWQVFRSRYIPAMLPILSYWSWPVKDVVGQDVGWVVNIWDKGYFQAIWEERGYKAVKEYSLNFLLSNVNNLHQIREKGLKAGQKVVDLCRTFALQAERSEVGDFANFFKDLDQTYNEFTKRSMLLWLFSGEAIQTEIKQESSGISEEEQTKIFSILSIPHEKSYSQEEEEKFWKIVELAKKKGLESVVVEKAMEKFSQEYFWFPYEYIGPTVWDVPTVRKRVLENLSSHIPGPTAVSPHRIDIKVSEQVENLFAVLRAVSLMQDDRKMLNAQICYYLNNVILKILAKKLGIALENLRYLEANTFGSLLNERLSLEILRQELKERVDFCVVIQDAEQYQVFSGRVAKDKLRELGIQEENHTMGEALHGQSAYKGKVTGRVKILHSSSEGQNFPDGGILVTGMTTPDFVPIIKKAAAIVTDEGGITSHAAIVSRELKIPCVIGTKTATRMLKDGDLVEVDAENGIVKILK